MNILAFIRLWIGAWLFTISGGVGLVLLGVLPIGVIIAFAGLLTGGYITAADIAYLSAIGTLYILIGIPVALYSAAMIDSALDDIFGVSLNVRRPVKAGAEKVPIIGGLLGVGIDG